MVGVLPVLRPVETVEVRLRHWTHQVVGIPLTIYRHSEALRGQRCGGPAASNQGEQPDFDKEIPHWVKDVANPFSVNYAFLAYKVPRMAHRLDDDGARRLADRRERSARSRRSSTSQAATAQTGVYLNFKEHVLKRSPAPPEPTKGVRSNEAYARHVANLRRQLAACVQASDRRARRAPCAPLGRRRKAVRFQPGITNPRTASSCSPDAIPVDRFQRGPQVQRGASPSACC